MARITNWSIHLHNDVTTQADHMSYCYYNYKHSLVFEVLLLARAIHILMAGKLEVIFMASVFVIVAGCFSIPIIIYATNYQDDTIKRSILDQLNFDITGCPQKVRITTSTIVRII